MSKKHLVGLLVLLMAVGSLLHGQDQAILVPKAVPGAPLVVDDSQDLFGKAWRFYREGHTGKSAGFLRDLIKEA